MANDREMGQQQYKDPLGGSDSSMGTQLRTDHFQRKALIELVKEQYFTQLADVTAMPKHSGKKIVRYKYVPLLDDLNINDQGIDATGTTIADGNLYGSSKDVGSIPSKMPALSEVGGRVNRVGFTRQTLEGSFDKFGFFDEYTRDSLDFDSDAELQMHIHREMLRGANEMSEDLLQIDLLNNAGVEHYAGDATADVEVDFADIVTYKDLMDLAIELNQNRTPKQTKVITGTRLIDTKTIAGGRVMYVGSELIPTLRAMKDLHDNPAFIAVQHYAAGTTVLTGEIGSVDEFRIVVVPEMMNWTGDGAATNDGSVHGDGSATNIYPMLVVGDGAFTTIGFQTDGKSQKFSIKHAKPGSPESYANDPYGETGFMSIKWWYGFMALRPERLALIKTAAKV